MTCRGVCEVWAICLHPEDLHAQLNILVIYDLSTFFTLCLIMMLIAPAAALLAEGMHSRALEQHACSACLMHRGSCLLQQVLRPYKQYNKRHCANLLKFSTSLCCRRECGGAARRLCMGHCGRSSSV